MVRGGGAVEMMCGELWIRKRGEEGDIKEMVSMLV